MPFLIALQSEGLGNGHLFMALWGLLLHVLPLVILAAAVSAGSVPLAIALAKRFDIMDHPDSFLKPHAKPTPYLGGLAIALGWFAVLLVEWFRGYLTTGGLIGIGVGGLAVAAIGCRDDIRHLPPLLRLGLCGAAAAGAVWFSGSGSIFIGQWLYSQTGIITPLWLARNLSIVAAVAIVLGACNSTNLLDGLDGLCAGVQGIIALGFGLLAVFIWADHFGNESRNVLSDIEYISSNRFAGRVLVSHILAAAAVGAAGGFLFWNFNPARIFMGDAGSLLLGFGAGFLLLGALDHGRLAPMCAGLAMVSMLIFDTGLAIWRRAVAGKPLFVGDRSHFYDQLIQRGHSVRKTVLICYALTGGTVLFGLILALLPGGVALLGLLVLWGTAIAAAWLGGFATPETGAPPAEEARAT